MLDLSLNLSELDLFLLKACFGFFQGEIGYNGDKKA